LDARQDRRNDGQSHGRETGDNDDALIDAAYACVAESDGFDLLMAGWAERFDRAEPSRRGGLFSGPIAQHIERANALLKRVPLRAAGDAVMAAVEEIDVPAMVLTPTEQVLGANDAGRELFHARVGAGLERDWLDPTSYGDFDSVLRSCRPGANRRHAILRLSAEPDCSELAECFVLDESSTSDAMVAVRLLNLAWSKNARTMIVDAFDLTDAEADIAEALHSGASVQDIADQRATSIRTVRTQLHAIFEKCDCGSQVELVRMLSMVGARTASHGGTNSASWADPWGRAKQAAVTSGGEVTWSWTGHEHGRPMILLHGTLTGYGIPAKLERALVERKIRLIAPCRPFFGTTTAFTGDGSAHDAIEAGASAVEAVMDNLGIERCPAIGFIGGIVPLVRLAARSDRITGLLGVGASFPVRPKTDLDHMPAMHRTALQLARYAPVAAELAMAAALRMLRLRGMSYGLSRMYGESAADRATIRDPAIMAMMAASASMLIAQGTRAYQGDLIMIASDWGDHLDQIDIPLNMLCGDQDKTYPPAMGSKVAERHDKFRYEVLPDCGQLLMYQAVDRIIAALDEL
jgi:pimeloyl-ACP methyl ester carboxylesterase/DNA-binding CsgD family transcriptional regulator